MHNCDVDGYQRRATLHQSDNMCISIDLPHFDECGWIKIHNAVPGELCANLVGVLERELNVPVRDRERWGDFGGGTQDLLPAYPIRAVPFGEKPRLSNSCSDASLSTAIIAQHSK